MTTTEDLSMMTVPSPAADGASPVSAASSPMPSSVTQTDTSRFGMQIVTFSGGSTFAALYAAEAWCAARGISVGRSDGRNPSGLLYGEYDIQKWHNLNARERAVLDGTLTGDGRNGPVTVSIKPRPADHAPASPASQNPAPEDSHQ